MIRVMTSWKVHGKYSKSSTCMLEPLVQHSADLCHSSGVEKDGDSGVNNSHG